MDFGEKGTKLQTPKLGVTPGFSFTFLLSFHLNFPFSFDLLFEISFFSRFYLPYNGQSGTRIAGLRSPADFQHYAMHVIDRQSNAVAVKSL